MERYTISCIQEEGCCAFCNSPLFVGDPAYDDTDKTGEIFCSKKCKKDYDIHKAELEKAQTSEMVSIKKMKGQ